MTYTIRCTHRNPLPLNGCLPTLDDDRVVFAGAYHGWGFHEDGAASGLRAARRLGATMAATGSRCQDGRRADPGALPDPDHAPAPRTGAPLLRTPRLQLVRRHRPSCRGCRDGCGRSPGSTPATTSTEAPNDTLRQRVDAFLAEHGTSTCAAARITALLQARVLGYVFNPLSLYWCHDADGVLRHVIAEVHNTYGGSATPICCRPTTTSPRWSTKKLYVSPFNDVDGYYLVRAPRPDAELDVTDLAAPRQPARVRRDHARQPGGGRASASSLGCSSSHRWHR